MPIDPAIATAFETKPNSPLTRAVSWIHGGVRSTISRIPEFRDHWQAEAMHALAHDGPVVVGLGDSITQGIGATKPTNGYLGLVLDGLTARSGEQMAAFNVSQSGATIADVLEIQLAALAASKLAPAAVVCTVGSNDLRKSFSLAKTNEMVTRLVDELPSGAVLATVPDVGSILGKKLNEHIREVASDRGVTIADLAERLTTWKGNAAEDRFHPNDAGYRIWAEAFLAALA